MLQRPSFSFTHVIPATRLSHRFLVLPLLLGAMLGSGCASTAGNPNEEERGLQTEAPTTDEASSRSADSDDELTPTVVAYREYKDPMIGFNRAMFNFNDAAYRKVLIPMARSYNDNVPDPVRSSVGNFFHNLRTPIYFVNSLLQLEGDKATTNLMRFGINTTIGILGIFDPATNRFDIEKADTNFNDTLAQYGVGYGTYLVLPFLGSTDLRNGTSRITELFLHPLAYLTDGTERVVIQGFDVFQDFAPAATQYENLLTESDDPYLFMRNLYLQGVQRDAAYEQKDMLDERADSAE